MTCDWHRPVCPIPHLGYCVRERCNFWDEGKEECSGDCIGEYDPLGQTQGHGATGPCTIFWTEDFD